MGQGSVACRDCRGRTFSFQVKHSMNHQDQELLVGYLLGALDQQEHAQLEIRLAESDRLRDHLADLREELSPLLDRSDHSVDPPEDLAQRTCRALWETLDGKHHEETVEERFTEISGTGRRRVHIHILRSDPAPDEDTPTKASDELAIPDEIFSPKVPLSPKPVVPREADTSPHLPATIASNVGGAPSSQRSRPLKSWGDSRPEGTGRSWSVADVIASVAVGILFALLIFPAVQYARNRAQVLMCQNKLRQMGENFVLYSHSHRGAPSLPPDRTNVAGWNTPLLRQSATLASSEVLASSKTPVKDVPRFEVPLSEEAWLPPETVRRHTVPRPVGSGSNDRIGYLVNGRYQSLGRSSSPRLAVLSGKSAWNAPMPGDSRRSCIGDLGQNVLYRDGHVRLHSAADPDPKSVLFLESAGSLEDVGDSQQVLLRTPETPMKP